MNDAVKLLEGLIPWVGASTVGRIKGEIQTLAEDQDKEWKKVSLLLLADAVEAFGLTGVEVAHKAVQDLLKNPAAPIDWVNPRTASDLVAKFQNMEAEDSSKVEEFFAKVNKTLGTLFATLIRNLGSVE